MTLGFTARGVFPRAWVMPYWVVQLGGAICNLDCTCCFFLSKELLYPGSKFRMADDLLELYLRQLVEAHADSPEVVVAWQGGEPTMMGLDFFRRSVRLAETLKQPGQRIVHTIQTNGTLLIRPAMEAMCGLLRAGEAPSQITDRYAKADAKRGRNESCPCGSGRKWKKCHGAPGSHRVPQDRIPGR